MIDPAIQHLRELLACNTENPPRSITKDDRIFRYLCGAVPSSFTSSVTDHGDGHVSFFAQRGAPRVLFNVHIDTVPIGDGWTVDPLGGERKDGRIYGRGACDIKGAAAVLLALANETDAPLALLFTTDEEGANGRCVGEFITRQGEREWELVVVAEPTQCRAVTNHRGFVCAEGTFLGDAGHSSEQELLPGSAIHQLASWSSRALAAARDDNACFNIGVISGGTASNVVSARASCQWSARVPPGSDSLAYYEEMIALAPDAQWQMEAAMPPLPAPGQDAQRAADAASEAGITPSEPVGFWTEAALFSAAGYSTFVLGPGDIAQAHTADEWVSLEQLELAYRLYRGIIQDD